MILPFVGWSSGNCVNIGVVQTAGSIDRLLEGERRPGIEFVVKGSDGTLAHQKRQRSRATAVVSGDKAWIIQITIHHLVLADGEVKLPTCIVTMRIGIKPPGKRQSELDEAAKRADWPLRSNHYCAGTSSWGDPAHRRSGGGKRARATQYGATGSSERTAIESGERSLYPRQPAHIGGKSIELTTEEEAHVASLIGGRNHGEPPSGNLRHDLAAPHCAGSLKAAGKGIAVVGRRTQCPIRHRRTNCGRIVSDRCAPAMETSQRDLGWSHT